jgi:hypothetical protein
MPASTRITSRSAKGQAPLSGLLPDAELDRRPTQRLGRLGDLGLELLLSRRRPGLAAAKPVLPASRNWRFQFPIDCSDTFARPMRSLNASLAPSAANSSTAP